MKRNLLLASLFLVLFFGGSTSFAVPTMGENVMQGDISLAGQHIIFDTGSFVINGEIMVSAKTLCEKLGTQVFTVEKTGQVIVYRDNIFMKFSPNQMTAYVNGKAKTMPVSSIIYKGELLIPASFAAKTLEMSYNARSASELAIDYRENLLEYQQIGFRHFKRINLSNWGVSFYVPEYWQKLSDVDAVYGVEDPFETYYFDVKFYPLGKQYSRAVLTESLLTDLKFKYGDDFKRLSNTTQTINGYKADALYYDLLENGVTNHYVSYVFFEQNNGYILTGKFPQTSNEVDAYDLIDDIIGTFSIIKLSINDQLEHYTELPHFFEIGMSLNSQIYSNMPVQNQFLFSGSIDQASGVKGFHVIVSKGSEEIDYYVPVIDGQYNSKIYTPFGLGKHNITIYTDLSDASQETHSLPGSGVSENYVDTTPETFDAFPNTDTSLVTEEDAITLDEVVTNALLMNFDMNTEDMVMKFSLLNTSSDAIKYLLPSDYVNYDALTVYSISNSLTYNLTNQFAKAKTLYGYVTSTYTYSNTVHGEGLLNMQQLLTVKEANAIELCFVYTGLLRSVDIPARVVRGISEEGIEYWVETYINGAWYVSAISLESGNSFMYFNLNRDIFYESFSSVELLPF